MEKEDIENILIKLHGKRQIFHSEGDFQCSLWCKIQSCLPNIKITAERPLERDVDAKEYIDMFLKCAHRVSHILTIDDFHYLPRFFSQFHV